MLAILRFRASKLGAEGFLTYIQLSRWIIVLAETRGVDPYPTDARSTKLDHARRRPATAILPLTATSVRLILAADASKSPRALTRSVDTTPPRLSGLRIPFEAERNCRHRKLISHSTCGLHHRTLPAVVSKS
jgi:hypothetical protein